MPNYEYKCTREGTTFELWQEVGSGAPPCPTCGAPTQKVFRPIRTIFKGSGFYLTDTRAEAGVGKSEEAPKADDKPSAESATETPAATDAQPAPKPDAGAGAATGS
jgi:putative FmdB family regulatory protein